MRSLLRSSLARVAGALVIVASAGCGGLPADAAAVFDLADAASAEAIGADTAQGSDGAPVDDTAGSDSSADVRATPEAPDDARSVPDATPPDTLADAVLVEVIIDDTATGTAVCNEPDGQLFDGHCYIPLNVRTWAEAHDFCETLTPAAHLVTITSAAEQSFVQGILDVNERWIGMSRLDGPDFSSSAYTWITHEPRTYDDWDTSVPSDHEPNGTGTCVRLLSTGFWADYYCDTKLNGICERDP